MDHGHPEWWDCPQVDGNIPGGDGESSAATLSSPAATLSFSGGDVEPACSGSWTSGRAGRRRAAGITTEAEMTMSVTHRTTDCDPDLRVTRSWLGWGVVAGPVYVITSLAQALTRPGFDLTRHEWSLLANGSLGWIQIANLIGSGLMVGACAVGLRRALTPGRAARWAPRLIAGCGLGMILAGVFTADPARGFPLGTPHARQPVSWHGLAHLVAGGLGFVCLASACFVLAGRYGTDRRPGWASWSRATGVLFLAGFVAVATGTDSPVATIGFTLAVVLVWAWLAAVAVERYRALSPSGSPAR
jgi:hypothetical protein